MSTVYFAMLQKEALKHMLLITLIKINETLLYSGFSLTLKNYVKTLN